MEHRPAPLSNYLQETRVPKFPALVAISLLSIGAFAPASAQVVRDGSFESVGVSTFVYNLNGSPWLFSGNSGVIPKGTQHFLSPAVAPGQGSQFAFVRPGKKGSVWSSVSEQIILPGTGEYELSFLEAVGGKGAIGLSVVASLDNQPLGQFYSQLNSGWSAEDIFFSAASGVHTLSFATDPKAVGDVAGFIDDVAITSPTLGITSTPEPASIALLATGLIAIAGVTARRKRQA